MGCGTSNSNGLTGNGSSSGRSDSGAQKRRLAVGPANIQSLEAPTEDTASSQRRGFTKLEKHQPDEDEPALEEQEITGVCVVPSTMRLTLTPHEQDLCTLSTQAIPAAIGVARQNDQTHRSMKQAPPDRVTSELHQVAEASSSTARLSVNSGSSTDAMLFPTTKRSEIGLAFFSASILALHVPHDTLELQKRLAGGYTDVESGVTYLTPKQRWNALLQETILFQEIQRDRVTPPPYLTGSGVLWIASGEEMGIPADLPPPAPRATEAIAPSFPQPSKTHRFQEKLFQKLLTTVSATIPAFDGETLVDTDMASYTVHQCAMRVKEFYSWSSETSAVNPSHRRLRAILGQLQVSLRDTAILLEDPKRYVEAFARIDPQGLMFQAEVLSLQDEVVVYQETPKPQSNTNPLQESFPDESSSSVRLTATKARDVVSLMIVISTNSSSSSEASVSVCHSGSNTGGPQLQLQTALRLFRLRAFRRLHYIALILRNTVEIEALFLGLVMTNGFELQR